MVFEGLTKTGRPPSCTCGECHKCKRAAYMREWYRTKTAERGHPATGNRDHEKVLAAKRKWAASPAGRATKKRGTLRYRLKYPEKERAKQRVCDAIRRGGKLVRQPCEICGDPKSHAHHPDYSRPLDVLWRCGEHHRRIHQEGF